MAVSIPDSSGAAPEPWPDGRADAPDRRTEQRPDPSTPQGDPSAASARRDALRSRSSGRQDASTGPHSTAEWITLAISSLIVVGLVALTTYFYLTDAKTPAIVEVQPRLAETYQAGSRYYLPVTVHNAGGETGEEVRVRVSLTARSGHQETTEIMVAFLAGGGSSRAVASFGTDPREGQVEAVVVSYLEP